MSKTKILADLVLKLTADKGEFNKGLNEVNSSLKEAGKNAKSAGKSIAESFKDMNATNASLKDMRNALAQLRNMSFKGKTVEEINEINSAIGHLREEMRDLTAVQQGMAVSFGEIAAPAIQGLASVAQGAFAVGEALGLSKKTSEEFNRVTLTLISVSQAAAAIDDLIATRKLQIIALKIRETAATIAQTVATKAQIVVQNILNASLATTAAAIAATVAIVATLAAGIYLLVKALKSETLAERNRRLAREQSIEIEKEAARLQAEELVTLNQAKKALNNKASSVDTVKRVIGELNEKYKANITTEGDLSKAIDKANQFIGNRIKLIGLEAKATATRNILIKAQEEELLASIEATAAAKEREGKSGFAAISANKKANAADQNYIDKRNQLLQVTRLYTVAQEELNEALGKMPNTSVNKGGKADLSPLDELKNKQTSLKEQITEIISTGKTVPEAMLSAYQSLTREIDSIIKKTTDANTAFNTLAKKGVNTIKIDTKPAVEGLKKLQTGISNTTMQYRNSGKEIAEISNSSFDFNQTIDQVGNLAGAMSGFFDQEKEEYKAFAIAQALISTYLAAAQVLASKMYPDLISKGIAMAATIAMGIANVAKIASFAQGGIVYGETFARVGEYANARSNPEVIAPLDKLKTILGQNSLSSGQVKFIIEGDALTGVLHNYSRKISKTR